MFGTRQRETAGERAVPESAPSVESLLFETRARLVATMVQEGYLRLTETGWLAGAREQGDEAAEWAILNSKGLIRMRRHGDGLMVEFEDVEDACPFVMRWFHAPLSAGGTVGDGTTWYPGLG